MMNPDKLSDLIVRPDASVREVMQAIDRTGVGMAIICAPERRLLGVITDGDVRRALLRGASLDVSAAELMNPTPITAQPDRSDAELLDLMNERGIRHVVVVDDAGEVRDLVVLTDLARELRPPLNMSAVVMAGGLGTRLGELTRDTPKPLLHVGGKPIIERIVDHLQDHGVGEVIITTRHLAEQIEGHFSDRNDGLPINYVREEERLGTAGALKYLEGRIDKPFLVMNGDLLTELDVRKLVEFHEGECAMMTIAVRHFTFRVPFGVVETDWPRVTGLAEKPTYDFVVNAGIYVLEPQVLRHIPAEQYFDITELIDAVLAAGDVVSCFPIVERWLDIGRPEDLERARSLFQDD